MKKVLSFVAVLFAVVAVNAQILHESFDNGIPSTWTTIDANGTGYNWVSLNDLFTQIGVTDMSAADIAFGGAGDCASSWSYYPVSYSGGGSFGGTSLDVKNYLITPAFVPQSGSSLSFYCMSFNGTQYPDDLSVLLSTAGNAQTDFTVTLMPRVTITESELTEYNYDLSAYAGQTVYVAFVHEGNDMFGLMLDEVTVTGNVGIQENDANVNIYPNPATTVLNVEANGYNTVEIVNLLGQVVYSANATSNMQINVSSLNSGAYFVRMIGANGTTTQKFIKK